MNAPFHTPAPIGGKDELREDGRFDWTSNDVVVRQQDAVAVYQNPYGDVVIRREAAWDEENDVCVVIARQNVPAVVEAILHTAGLEPEDPGGADARALL
jgi:hypothetical protein